MERSEVVLLSAVCFLGAVSVFAGMRVGRADRKAGQVIWAGLLIATVCYLVLLSCYSAMAAVSFDGLCYPLLQAPRPCGISEHVLQVLALVGGGMAPLLPIFFMLSTGAALLARRVRRVGAFPGEDQIK